MAYPLLDTNIGDKIVAGHRILEIGSAEAEAYKAPNGEIKFYEVIRAIGGVPLFLEDHMDRLEASLQAEKAGGEAILFDRSLLREEIRMLAKAVGMQNGNIKIILTKSTRLLFSSEFYYPSAQDYDEGVCVGALSWQRADPNVKMVREDYKAAVAEKLRRPGPFGPYFETLLIDGGGLITEGSRSNVFFVRGGCVYTAPDEDILKGITRKYVLQAIRNAGAQLAVGKWSVGDVRNFHEDAAAFLSGTSIGVLPIRAVEDIPLSSAENSTVRAVRKEYEKIIQNYLNAHKDME